MTNVYIVNNSGHDFSKAEQFGKLVVLSEGLIDPYKVTGMFRKFSVAMKDSKPTDWILHSGPAVMNCIACGIFAHKHSRINLLIWNRSHYVKRIIILKDLDNEQSS